MTEVILAIDPGDTSGVAVLTVEAVPRLLGVAIKRFGRETATERVRRIRESCEHQGYDLGLAYIEKQFIGKNKDSARKLILKAGRWEEACAVAGLVVAWIDPQSWQSRMLTGLCSGRAKSKERKAACQHLVRLRWHRELSEDEADAAVMGAYAAEVLHGQVMLKMEGRTPR